MTQFLVVLNNGHEVVRNQILSVDSLPTVKEAYYIVQQLDKQKQVSEIVNTRIELSWCLCYLKIAKQMLEHFNGKKKTIGNQTR